RLARPTGGSSSTGSAAAPAGSATAAEIRTGARSRGCTADRRARSGALLLLLRPHPIPLPLIDEVVEPLLELLGRVRLRQVAVDRDHVAQRLVLVVRPRAVPAERHRRLAQADLALRLDEPLAHRDADPGRAAARVERIDVLAARRQVVGDLLLGARQANLVGALGDAEDAGGLVVAELHDVGQ